MSTIAPSPSIAVQPRRARVIVAALVALVAAAAAVLVIALSGSSATHAATPQVSAPSPLIHYYGTGAAPQAPSTGAAVHSGAPAVIRHEKSYGAVP
jgi:hypothetical protein